MGLPKALQSLAGLSVGDALGERLFFAEPTEFQSRKLPPGPWRYTDDTEMALSIVEQLRDRGRIDQDRLATAFALRYSPKRGYGSGAHQLLEGIGSHPTGYWRTLAPAMFCGRGSFGNGAAMRVAPLGAFFEGQLELTAEQAALSAQVTHSHPEGIAGAVAVAVAASWLSGNPIWDRKQFFANVLDFLPASLTRQGIERASTLPANCDPFEAAQILGNGDKVSAQDTVPFCLWSVAQNPDSFTETFWSTVSVGGDQDTNCAIVGGIVACRIPPPADWLGLREALPADFT